MRVNTGPVMRELKSKYWRRTDSGRFWLKLSGLLLSDQYVPRHPTAVFTVRKGHLVNGNRIEGLTSTRVSPVFDASTSSSVVLRRMVKYSVLTPKYTLDDPIGLSPRENVIRGRPPVDVTFSPAAPVMKSVRSIVPVSTYSRTFALMLPPKFRMDCVARKKSC